MMDGALWVDFWLELAGHVGELFATKDVEVVIGCVSAGVAFSADSSAEYDEVFGNAWKLSARRSESRLVARTGMDDVHGAHCATCIVKHPFTGIGIEGDFRGRVRRGKVSDDMRNHSGRVVG